MPAKKATPKKPVAKKAAPAPKRKPLKLHRAKEALSQGANPHAVLGVLIEELEAHG